MNLTTSSDAVTGESVVTSYFICELSIALFAVVGNSSIIAAFAMNRRIRTIQNYYIVSLAAIDFSMGFFAIPFVLITLDGERVQRMGVCFFLLTVIVLMDLCSIFSIWALTFDRFYAVCRPFSYHAVMTRKRTIIHIAAAWLIPIAISALVPLGWNIADENTKDCLFPLIVSMQYYAVLYFFCFLPLFFVMCLMYRRIFTVIQKQLSSLAQIQAIGIRLNNPSINNMKDDNDQGDDGGSGGGGEDKRQRNEQTKEDDNRPGFESKHKRRESKRSRRDWDVTDEILLLKKIKETNPESNITTVSGLNRSNENNLSKNGLKMRASKTDARVDEKERTPLEVKVVNNEHHEPPPPGGHDETTFLRFHRIKQERKTALLFVFILLFFFISWSPIYIIDVCLAFDVNVNQNLVNFAVLLSHFNSAVNPILYASKSEFRRIFKKWIFVISNRICKVCCKNRVAAMNLENTANDFTQTFSRYN